MTEALLHQESDEGTLLQLLRRNEETGARQTSMVAVTRLSLYRMMIYCNNVLDGRAVNISFTLLLSGRKVRS
jgi:hypothetical protein